jgi:hypothetical protein
LGRSGIAPLDASVTSRALAFDPLSKEAVPTARDLDAFSSKERLVAVRQELDFVQVAFKQLEKALARMME